MFDGIAMKVARCGGLWNASRIVRLLQENGSAASLRSGLTDPELSLAATAHLFAWADLELPDRAQRAAIPRGARHDGSGIPRRVATCLHVPTGPGSGIESTAAREKSMTHCGGGLEMQLSPA